MWPFKLDFKPQTDKCNNLLLFSQICPYQPPSECVRVKVVVGVSEDGLLFGVVASSEPVWLTQVWYTGLSTTTRPERGRHTWVRQRQNSELWDIIQSPWPPVWCYLRSYWEFSTGFSLGSGCLVLGGRGVLGGSGVRSARGTVGSTTANTKLTVREHCIMGALLTLLASLWNNHNTRTAATVTSVTSDTRYK